MAAEFRCEKCGKLLKLDSRPGQTVKCPHCHKRIVVPEALASLPSPQVAFDAPPQQVQEPPVDEAGVGRAMAVVTQAMPWVISLLFHAGLALSMALVTILVVENNVIQIVNRPDARLDTKGDKVSRRDTEMSGVKNPNQRQAMQPLPSNTRGFAAHEGPADNPSFYKGSGAMTISRLGGTGGGGSGGPLAPQGPTTPGGVQFLGSGARADDVVYVIDRSGSMAAGGAFDLLRLKLAESVAGLVDAQTFHVIFFGEKKEPIELSKRALAPATPEHKQDLVEFLDNVIPEGQTLVMSSLKRTFEVLSRVPEKRAKLICLLSDGGFEGFIGGTNEYTDRAGKAHTGNDAVVAWLDDNNKKIKVRDENGNVRLRREVQINTFLYRPHDQAKDSVDVAVMKKIAEQHDGKFTHVQD